MVPCFVAFVGVLRDFVTASHLFSKRRSDRQQGEGGRPPRGERCRRCSRTRSASWPICACRRCRRRACTKDPHVVIDARQCAPCDLVLVDRRDVDHHDRLFRGPDADRWPAQPFRRLGRSICGCVAHGVPACARSRRAASSLRRIRRVGEPPRCRRGRRRCSAPQDGQRRGSCTSRRPPRIIDSAQRRLSGPGSVPGSGSVPGPGTHGEPLGGLLLLMIAFHVVDDAHRVLRGSPAGTSCAGNSPRITDQRELAEACGGRSTWRATPASSRRGPPPGSGCATCAAPQAQVSCSRMSRRTITSGGYNSITSVTCGSMHWRSPPHVGQASPRRLDLCWV